MSINNSDLLDRFVSGESFDELAEDLGVTRENISDRVGRMVDIALNTPVREDDSDDMLDARTDYMERLALRLNQQNEEDQVKIDRINAEIDEIQEKDRRIGEGIGAVIWVVVLAFFLFAIFSIA